ncbi:MAG: hypothetical protein PHG25_03250 [Candidatus Pacebacteria bacterium]|nr:hypothetical protein [Candidatus Paceibacterota bacterium]
MSNENIPPLYRASQEDVMAGYVRSKAFRNKDEQGQLHMFFSPTRVPLGLTNQQIRVCLNIAKLKNDRDKAERDLAISKIRPLDEFPEYMKNDEEFMMHYLFELAKASIGGRTYPKQLPHELICAEFMTDERFNQGIVKFLATL